MPGLTIEGFEGKTLEEILADFTSSAEAVYGPSIRTDAQSVLGQLFGIQAEPLLELWELSQALYDAFNVDNAQGAQLDNLAALVGVVRDPATKASGTVTLFGTDTTVVPQGSIVASSVDDSQYVTLADATIGATVSGEVDVAVEAEEAGAQTVLTGEITLIITPVAGWSSVTNAADFTPGVAVETDAQLRARRENSLQIIGAATDGAIRARVLDLDDVTDCKVISNRTLVTAGGIPGKAFETIIWPDTGVDEDRVAATIFQTMPAGIQPYGESVTKLVSDAQGIQQTVEFTYATRVDIGIEVDVTTDADFPADGTSQIATQILAVAASEFVIGADVRILAIQCAVNEVPGVVTAVVRMDTKPPFPPAVGTSNIPIADDEIAILDSADIIVAVV